LPRTTGGTWTTFWKALHHTRYYSSVPQPSSTRVTPICQTLQNFASRNGGITIYMISWYKYVPTYKSLPHTNAGMWKQNKLWIKLSTMILRSRITNSNYRNCDDYLFVTCEYIISEHNPTESNYTISRTNLRHTTDLHFSHFLLSITKQVDWANFLSSVGILAPFNANLWHFVCNIFESICFNSVL
jgi:hypothetical protein